MRKNPHKTLYETVPELLASLTSRPREKHREQKICLATAVKHQKKAAQVCILGDTQNQTAQDHEQPDLAKPLVLFWGKDRTR